MVDNINDNYYLKSEDKNNDVVFYLDLYEVVIMTEKRFVDIEISADIGQIRLYTDDTNYENYRGEELLDLLNRLYEESIKIKNILKQRRNKLNDDYNRSVRAGMPTGAIIGELDTIEEILEEMGWTDDRYI